MNRYQRQAYGSPLGDEELPSDAVAVGRLARRRFSERGHVERYVGVELAVMLIADTGGSGEELFGRRGCWRCSVGVRTRGEATPVGEWTPMQRRAAERVAMKSLEGVGERPAEGARAIACEERRVAVHWCVPMTEPERAGLGCA